MKLLSTLAIGGLFLSVGGCSLFSSMTIGKPTASIKDGDNIEDVVQSLGAPDVVGGNAKYLVLGWRHAEGMSILGLFETFSETTHAAVFNDKGQCVGGGASNVESGKGLSILPFSPLPVMHPSR